MLAKEAEAIPNTTPIIAIILRILLAPPNY